jgi:hypothetical protein
MILHALAPGLLHRSRCAEVVQRIQLGGAPAQRRASSARLRKVDRCFRDRSANALIPAHHEVFSIMEGRPVRHGEPDPGGLWRSPEGRLFPRSCRSYCNARQRRSRGCGQSRNLDDSHYIRRAAMRPASIDQELDSKRLGFLHELVPELCGPSAPTATARFPRPRSTNLEPVGQFGMKTFMRRSISVASCVRSTS